jgi:signal peptidase
MWPVLTITRRAILALWLTLLGLVLGLVLMTHVAGALGYRVVIIRGSSMAPTIPLGAVVFEQPAGVSTVAPGDVVTLSLPTGTVVTHRVVRVATVDALPYLETRGDANATADPTLEPATLVTGVVRFHVPVAGFLLAFVGIPSGLLSVISMLGSLLAGAWLLEELEADRSPAAIPTDFAGHGVPA